MKKDPKKQIKVGLPQKSNTTSVPQMSQVPNMSTVNGPAVGLINRLKPKVNLPSPIQSSFAGINAPTIGSQFGAPKGAENTMATPATIKSSMGAVPLKVENKIENQPTIDITQGLTDLTNQLTEGIQAGKTVNLDKLKQAYPEFSHVDNTILQELTDQMTEGLSQGKTLNIDKLKVAYPELNQGNIEEQTIEPVARGYRTIDKEQNIKNFKDALSGVASWVPKAVMNTLGFLAGGKPTMGLDLMNHIKAETEGKEFVSVKEKLQTLGKEAESEVTDYIGGDPESFNYKASQFIASIIPFILMPELGGTEIGVAGVETITQLATKFPKLYRFLNTPVVKKVLQNTITSIPGTETVSITSEGRVATPGELGIGAIAQNVLTEGLGAIGKIGTKSIPIKSPVRVPFTEPVEVNITPEISNKIQKTIKPTVVEKKGASVLKQFEKDTVTAVDTVLNYQDKIKYTNEFGEEVSKVPETLREFSQGIEQSKQQIFNEYDALARQANGQGVSVNTNRAIAELTKMRDNLSKMPGQKKAVSYIDETIIDLQEHPVLDVMGAQNTVKAYNSKLDAFYRNPNYNDVDRAVIDAIVNNNIRAEMDATIEGAIGTKEYAVLKDKYRALKNVEKEVNKRAIVAGRANEKGLLDFSDLISADQAVRGIVNVLGGNLIGGARDIAGATAMNRIKRWIKNINNPDKNMRDLFKLIQDGRTNIFTPKLLKNVASSVNLSSNTVAPKNNQGLQKGLGGLKPKEGIPKKKINNESINRGKIMMKSEGIKVKTNPNITAENSVVQVFDNKGKSLGYKTIPDSLKVKALEFDTNPKMFAIGDKQYHLTAGEGIKRQPNLGEMSVKEFNKLKGISKK